MALWGDTDTADDAPKYLTTDQKNNETFFIDTVEAAVDSNREKGLKTGGWNLYSTYTDANGATRQRVEPLVAMRRTEVQAGDEGVSGNTAVEDATVADS